GRIVLYGHNIHGGKVIFLRLTLLGRLPKSPQRWCRRRRSYHAATETIVENLKQFIEDGVGEDALPVCVEQRQNEAEEIGVTFQAVFLRGWVSGGRPQSQCSGRRAVPGSSQPAS